MKIGSGKNGITPDSSRSPEGAPPEKLSGSYQFKPVQTGIGHKSIPGYSGDLDVKGLDQYAIKPEVATGKLLDLEGFTEPEPTMVVGLEMVNAHPKQGLPRSFLMKFMDSCSKLSAVS
ncbi:hypothetical protein [Endozoicomonas arenosclerae]|uniref:hypothetical protein n=1 Tax=Endozoicomonas arenosclerae TaxID=1633495 RepID=UPI0007830D9D|nr:hypothetical protein [Endozoicomonas arenosclerae]